MKLCDLLKTFNDRPQDVDLYHWDYDHESATMVELSMKDFTEKGLEKFNDILNAEVVRLNAMGENWVSIFVKDVKLSCVEDLSNSYAGQCSVDDYNLWFTMDAEEAN